MDLRRAGRPFVIAHRGASGYLPELSLEAYAYAYATGADILEMDVVMTRDGVLLCAHDLTAETTTDVATRFPDRAGADGRWAFADLSFDEVKGLALFGRDMADRRGYQVAALDELLTMVRELNAGTSRRVGVIIEPKNPAAHRERGMDIERALLGALSKRGFMDEPAPDVVGTCAPPAIIQSFDRDAIERLRRDAPSHLPLLYLVDRAIDGADAAWAAGVAQGIGPALRLVEETDLLSVARGAGLAVFPWTFGADRALLERFFSVHAVDAVFADYPDLAIGVRDGL